MDKATLTALRGRIAEAKRPSSALDAWLVAVANDMQVRPYPPATDFGPQARWQFWTLDGAHFLGNESKFPVPAYTASVDAALGLVERLLPGWPWMLRGRWAKVWKPGAKPPGNDFSADGETPALALLCVLLDALLSRGGSPNGE